MKRLIICCDGTWNSLQRPSQASRSNVAEIARAIPPQDKDGIPQVVFYDDGVGTGYLAIDRLLGGAIGLGIDENILEAYRFLCMNYCPGDEIYMFGFSRGSYTIRSLGGLISRVGLLRQDQLKHTWEAYKLYRRKQPDCMAEPEAYYAFKEEVGKFKANHSIQNQVNIKLLCCWDTVGSLGIPTIPPLMPLRWLLEVIFDRKYSFHDTTLSSAIDHAIHAIALHENRRVFDLTPMELPVGSRTSLSQCWFAGNHGCCGGGTRELSSINFVWVVEEMQKLGLLLELNPAVITENRQQQDISYNFNSFGQQITNFAFSVFNWPPFLPHKRKNPDGAVYHPTASALNRTLSQVIAD
ncbi:MAG: DUF2235 domain-containing protein [Elainellaceae cyanobacterium]